MSIFFLIETFHPNTYEIFHELLTKVVALNLF